MQEEEKDDPVWPVAWRWVTREYDRESFDERARAELASWLLADPRHRQAYERAARVWLLAGLVPPASDLGEWDARDLPPPEP